MRGARLAQRKRGLGHGARGLSGGRRRRARRRLVLAQAVAQRRRQRVVLGGHSLRHLGPAGGEAGAGAGRTSRLGRALPGPAPPAGPRGTG